MRRFTDGLSLADCGFSFYVNGGFDLKPRRVVLRLRGETLCLSNTRGWKGKLSQSLVKKSESLCWFPGAESQHPQKCLSVA